MQGFSIFKSTVETVENCISVFEIAMSTDDNFTISGKRTSKVCWSPRLDLQYFKGKLSSTVLLLLILQKLHLLLPIL